MYLLWQILYTSSSTNFSNLILYCRHPTRVYIIVLFKYCELKIAILSSSINIFGTVYSSLMCFSLTYVEYSSQHRSLDNDFVSTYFDSPVRYEYLSLYLIFINTITTAQRDVYRVGYVKYLHHSDSVIFNYPDCVIFIFTIYNVFDNY